jgi:hypothetical protein
MNEIIEYGCLRHTRDIESLLEHMTRQGDLN